MAGVISPFLPEFVPTGSGTPSGGDITSTPLPQTTTGAFIPDLVIPPEGDPDIGPWHYALGCQNTGDATLSGLLFWIVNGLKRPLAQGTWALQADADCTDWFRVQFKYGGEWTIELKQANGTTAVLGDFQMDEDTPVIVECTNSTGDTLMNTTANVRLSRGISLGYVPTGAKHGTSEHLLGIDLVQDSDAQTDDREDPPDDVDFYEAFTKEESLSIPDDDLAATHFIKLWFQTTGFAGVDVLDYIKPLVKWWARG